MRVGGAVVYRLQGGREIHGDDERIQNGAGRAQFHMKAPIAAHDQTGLDDEKNDLGRHQRRMKINQPCDGLRHGSARGVRSVQAELTEAASDQGGHNSARHQIGEPFERLPLELAALFCCGEG